MPFHRTLLVALVFAVASAEANAAETYRNPVIDDNLADPVVIHHEGTYYLYATGEVNGDNGYRVYNESMIMLTRCALLTALILGPQALLPAVGDDAQSKTHETLLLEDNFERDEATPDKEDIGNGWTSNSAWRAKGHKQVDLVDGAMHVTRHAEADHGVAIFHNVAFQDGAIEIKFKLRPGDDLGLDFVDRELKTVHAGHPLWIAELT